MLPAWLVAAAFATVPDTFGMGAEQIGRGGGGVAQVDDGAAALMNPAGLARIRRPTFAIGGLWGRQAMAEPPPLWWDTNRDGRVDENDEPLRLPDGVDNLSGFQVQIGRHVGGRFGLGLSAYMPTQRLFRLKTIEPSLPHYILYDNRAQRYVLAAGVGGEVAPGVSIGLAADIVPKVRFTVAMTADLAVEGDSEAEDLGELVGDVVIDVHEIRLDVVPGVAPVVGLQLDLGRWSRHLRGLQLGAMWRGQVGVPIEADLDIQANIRVNDVGELSPLVLAGLIDTRLFLFDHFVPMKVEFGASYRVDPWFSAYVDARWTDWRKLMLSVARIEEATLTTPLFDLGDTIRDGNAFRVFMRPTWTVKAGGSLALPRFEFDNRARYLQLRTSAGAGYEQSPLVEQGSSSALLDSDRWWLAGGLSAEFWDPFRLVNGPVRFAAFFQYHRLLNASLPRASDTPRAGYSVDGSSIPVGGSILLIGGELGFDY